MKCERGEDRDEEVQKINCKRVVKCEIREDSDDQFKKEGISIHVLAYKENCI